MGDIKLATSIQSKALIMGESIHGIRSGTFTKNAQHERAHLTAGKVPGVGVNVSRAKHAEEVVRNDRWCRHYQSSRRFEVAVPRRDRTYSRPRLKAGVLKILTVSQQANMLEQLCERNCVSKTTSRTYRTGFFSTSKSSHGLGKVNNDNRRNKPADPLRSAGRRRPRQLS